MRASRILRKGPWAIVLLLALVVGCGGQKEEAGSSSTAERKPAATQQQATVVDAATAGTVTGRVDFSGTPPKMQMIDMSSEGACSHGSVMTQNVIVNDNNTLRYTFVYVKQGLEGMSFPPPSTPVVLDQQGCTYIPHVFGIQAGQPLTIKNSDEGVLHNIHTLSKMGNGFNFGMPKVMESQKEFKKAEVMVRIKCDVHGWMSAYCGVLDHPYYAVTGENGTFSLSSLPPGEYVIEAWHEEYGTQTQTVTVGPKETKDISFTFEPSS